MKFNNIFIFLVLILLFSVVLIFKKKHKESYKEFHIKGDKLEKVDPIHFNKVHIIDNIEKKTELEEKLVLLKDFLKISKTKTPRFVYCIKEKGDVSKWGLDKSLIDNNLKFDDWELKELDDFSKGTQVNSKGLCGYWNVKNVKKIFDDSLDTSKNYEKCAGGNDYWGNGDFIKTCNEPSSSECNKKEDCEYDFSKKECKLKSYEGQQTGDITEVFFQELKPVDLELTCVGNFKSKIKLSESFLNKISINDKYKKLCSASMCKQNHLLHLLLKNKYYKDINITENPIRSNNIMERRRTRWQWWCQYNHPRLYDNNVYKNSNWVTASWNGDEPRRVDGCPGSPWDGVGVADSEARVTYKWDWNYKIEIYEVYGDDGKYSNFFEKNVKKYDEDADLWGTSTTSLTYKQINNIKSTESLVGMGIFLKVFDSDQDDFEVNKDQFFGEQKYTDDSKKYDDGSILYNYIKECNSTVEIKDALIVEDKEDYVLGTPDWELADPDKPKYPLIQSIKRAKNLPIHFKDKICLKNDQGKVACLTAENIDVINGIRPIKINTFPRGHRVEGNTLKFDGENQTMCMEAAKVNTLGNQQYAFKAAPCDDSFQQDFFLKFYDNKSDYMEDYHAEISTKPKQPHIHIHKHLVPHELKSEKEIVRTNVEDNENITNASNLTQDEIAITNPVT